MFRYALPRNQCDSVRNALLLQLYSLLVEVFQQFAIQQWRLIFATGMCSAMARPAYRQIAAFGHHVTIYLFVCIPQHVKYCLI
jgi:hypothetical protein